VAALTGWAPVGAAVVFSHAHNRASNQLSPDPPWVRLVTDQRRSAV